MFVTAGGKRMRGEVASGRGQASQSDLRVHFGLGAATEVTSLEVRWANGPAVKYTVPRIDAVDHDRSIDGSALIDGCSVRRCSAQCVRTSEKSLRNAYRICENLRKSVVEGK